MIIRNEILGGFIKLIRNLIIVSCLLITVTVKAQNPRYQLKITNEVQPTPNTYEFDVFLLQTGITPFELFSLNFGIGINIDVKNGGTLSAAIISGTSELPISQIPNTVSMGTINYTSNTANCGSCDGTGITYNYMNVAPTAYPGPGNGAIISNVDAGCSHPGTRVGRFRITNSTNFTNSVSMNIVWSASPGSQKSNTVVNAFVGTMAVDITNIFYHLNWNSPNTCATNPPLISSICLNAPVARANGPYSSCGNVVLSGSVSGSATSATWSSPTGGIFSPNANSLNATYSPSSADLSNGSVILTLTSNNPNGSPCTADANTALITFISCDDGNGCTIDACNALGICTHTPVDVNDNNGCTTDACNVSTGTITHTPINIDDNNICTTDACITSTGVITHTQVNINDNNLCTADGCNPVTGVFHTPVNTNDNNICTIDACNSSNGVITHTAVNTNDGNPCTIDGCDPITGIFHNLSTEICGNGIDDNCNGLIDEGCGCISPAMPGTVTVTGGSAKVCPGETRTYTVPLVSGVSWNWTAPAGAVINNGQGTRSVNITYNAGFTTNDTLRVVAVNPCVSQERKLLITRNNPATPSTITGQNFGVCNLSGVPYSVTTISGVTYNWSFTISGANISSGQGSHAVTANYSSSYVTGSIRVSASNSCGTSTYRTKVIKATPTAPTAITGDPTVCANQLGVPYSISSLAGAITYTWTGPTGSHIVANAVTSSNNIITTSATAVSVNYAASAGSLKVRGNNTCGSGSTKSLTISFVCREQEISNENTFNAEVYPNPASGNFTIQLINKPEGDLIIELTDLIGRIVETITTKNDVIAYDGKSLSKGIYLLRIKQENELLVKQVIVLK